MPTSCMPTFKIHFLLNENLMLIEISLNNKSPFVQITASYRTSDKPLSELMMA